MDTQTLYLKALKDYINSNGKVLFNELLKYAGDKKFSYPVVMEALKDKWPTGPARTHLTNALHACAESRGLNLDQLAAAYSSKTKTDNGDGQLPAELRGAWFLVQYRGKRGAVSDQIPAMDYRTAVLVYGEDEPEVGRAFQVIGETTIWLGHAKKRDKQIYYFAEETERPGIDEALLMIMLMPYTGGEIVDHHGINLSVAHGQNDGPEFPIFASRVLLMRIDCYGSKLVAPLADDEKSKLKRYCEYVSISDFESGKFPRVDEDEIMRELRAAIERFIDRGKSLGNEGHRISLRR